MTLGVLLWSVVGVVVGSPGCCANSFVLDLLFREVKCPEAPHPQRHPH